MAGQGCFPKKFVKEQKKNKVQKMMCMFTLMTGWSDTKGWSWDWVVISPLVVSMEVWRECIVLVTWMKFARILIPQIFSGGQMWYLQRKGNQEKSDVPCILIVKQFSHCGDIRGWRVNLRKVLLGICDFESLETLGDVLPKRLEAYDNDGTRSRRCIWGVALEHRELPGVRSCLDFTYHCTLKAQASNHLHLRSCTYETGSPERRSLRRASRSLSPLRYAFIRTHTYSI